MTESVTMTDLRKACEDRLDDALSSGEARVRELSRGISMVEFVTPAGLELCRYGGMLTVMCDFSELGDDAPQRKVAVEFFDDEEVPEVTEINWSDRGSGSRTIKRKNHDALAVELSKYVTLIP